MTVCSVKSRSTAMPITGAFLLPYFKIEFNGRGSLLRAAIAKNHHRIPYLGR